MADLAIWLRRLSSGLVDVLHPEVLEPVQGAEVITEDRTMADMARVGLASRIKRAVLEGKDVDSLLLEGAAYKYASAKTKKRWARLAGKKS